MKKLYVSFMALLCAFAVNAQSLTGNATTLPASLPNSTDYLLTPAAEYNRGAYWNNTQVNLANNFSVTAQLNFGTQTGAQLPNVYTSGADGIAFVLQSTGVSALGDVGEGIGYGGITNSFAVEMDTWRNENRNDIQDDHLAFMKNGDVTHGTAANSNTDRYALPDLEDGMWHTVTIAWNAAAMTLSVTLDGTTRSFTGNIASIIGTGTVTWGFTAATGSAVNRHQIRFLAEPACTPFTVNVSVPALACSNGNTIYIGYGPQSVTATTTPTAANTVFKWYMVGSNTVVYTGATFTPTMAGVYYVVATQGDCTATNAGTPVNITVMDVRCGNNNDKVNVCHKEEGVHGNGTIGANSRTLCVAPSAVRAHLDHGDCLGECPGTNLRDGLNNAASNMNFTVFPNPTTNTIRLNIEALTGEKSDVIIRDGQGNIVSRKTVVGNAQPSFDLRKYGTGVFVVQIISGSDIKTQKVLVKE